MELAVHARPFMSRAKREGMTKGNLVELEKDDLTNFILVLLPSPIFVKDKNFSFCYALLRHSYAEIKHKMLSSENFWPST